MRHRHRQIAVAAVVAAAAAAGAASAATPVRHSPCRRLSLRPGALSSPLRVGQTIRFSGRVRCRARSVATLQGRVVGPHVRRWRALERAPLPAGAARFSLRWKVPSSLQGKQFSIRVAVLVHGRAAAFTIPVTGIIGPSVVKCLPPVPPAVNIPPGDGWIVGGLYDEGGPYPGINECSPTPYTVTATDSYGRTLASVTVPGRASYTIVVPAGSYTLASGACHGSATVTAGHGTQANVYCLFP